MRPIFISNLVTFAQTVSELLQFYEIQDGGVRHVGFSQKLGFSDCDPIVHHEFYLWNKFGDNRLSGSRVINF